MNKKNKNAVMLRFLQTRTRREHAGAMNLNADMLTHIAEYIGWQSLSAMRETCTLWRDSVAVDVVIINSDDRCGHALALRIRG